MNIKENKDNQDFHQLDETSILDSLKTSKIIFPIFIGLVVVGWMMYTQLDLKALASINLNGHTLFWISMFVFMYILRHLFYAWRLRIMSDNAFSWKKAIELIVIWEFSSAVSPTSVGGAGVAFFLLSQENLSGAKTITVVLYSMVIDTLLFILFLPIFYIILGPIMIRPDMVYFSDIDGYGITFLTVLGFMTAYGMLFYYGLFINPRSIKRLLLRVSHISFLKKFKTDLKNTAYDVMTTSKEIKLKPWSFHFKSFGVTIGAWLVRFFAINCLILAFVSNIDLSFYDHLIALARGMAMHVITSFSPTPGASGIAEYLFGGFFRDYIPEGIASLVALVWRIVSFYAYLIAGAIVIPLWIKNMRRKKKERLNTNRI